MVRLRGPKKPNRLKYSMKSKGHYVLFDPLRLAEVIVFLGRFERIYAPKIQYSPKMVEINHFSCQKNI